MVFKEIANLVNNDVKTLLGQVKVTMLSSCVVCVQNFVKLLTFSNQEVCFKIKNNQLLVEGENLVIKELGVKEVVISGNINKIYFSKETKNVKN